MPRVEALDRVQFNSSDHGRHSGRPPPRNGLFPACPSDAHRFGALADVTDAGRPAPLRKMGGFPPQPTIAGDGHLFVGLDQSLWAHRAEFVYVDMDTFWAMF